MARKKLRAQAPPLTETLQPQLLETVVATLFPNIPDHSPPIMVEPQQFPEEEETEVPLITSSEVRVAVTRLRAKNTAPGPDGVPGRVLALALRELEEHLIGLLNECLATSRFPSCWKTGKLVLLKKDGRPAELPSAYRPIVLLDETGKLFERILASRITQHLRNEGPDLAECQYGFRRGRSTIDAISRVKALSKETTDAGGVMLAISLDIANAFNTLPFSCIEEALRYHRVPPYIRRTIGAYLRGREIVYVNQTGEVCRRTTQCGVPQGSVLGPLLWNIGYDWVLRGNQPPGVNLLCYADDTLVVARGPNYDRAARLAEAAAEEVVQKIEALGLKVALNKTEVLCFHGPRRAPPVDASVTIGGVAVGVKPHMKYLGLVLDSRWNFKEHFRRLAPKLIGAADALGRLLPNVGGPSVTCRRLYAGIVRSMALYGAPVWADALNADNRSSLFRPQRVMAIRAIRGYRTISHVAACVLAGTPPWDLDAEVQAEVYTRCAEARSSGVDPPIEVMQRWRRSAQRALMNRWEERLREPNAGERTVSAVRQVLEEWVGRRHGSLTFRVTQILSGHGCFGRYLCYIAGREPLPACHHCSCSEDTAEHTVEVCPAWDNERASLRDVVGTDLSLPTIIRSMVESERSWEAVVAFCELTMSQKETAERTREDDPSSQTIRRKRTGRRRRQYSRQLLP